MMKWAVIIVGLITGFCAGAALLLVYPVDWLPGSTFVQRTSQTRLSITDASHRGIEATVGAMLGLGQIEGGGFMDPALRNSRISVAVLDPVGEAGAPALAVKLSAVAPDNNLLRSRLVAVSDWNLYWPGHGSLFLAGIDNYWPLLKDAIWSALTGSGFHVHGSHLLSPVSELAATQRVIGASGKLERLAGSYREWQEYDASNGAEGTLELDTRVRR